MSLEEPIPQLSLEDAATDPQRILDWQLHVHNALNDDGVDDPLQEDLAAGQQIEEKVLLYNKLCPSLTLGVREIGCRTPTDTHSEEIDVFRQPSTGFDDHEYNVLLDKAGTESVVKSWDDAAISVASFPTSTIPTSDRPPSPFKNVKFRRVFLQSSNPRIFFGRHEVVDDSMRRHIIPMPSTVKAMARRFSYHRALCGCIPFSLKDDIEELGCHDFIPDHAFSKDFYKSEKGTAIHAQVMLDHVLDIKNKADSHFSKNSDEFKWHDVIRLVLQPLPFQEVSLRSQFSGGIVSPTQCEISLENVQDYPVQDDLLPSGMSKLVGLSSVSSHGSETMISSVKVDFLLSLEPQSPRNRNEVSLCVLTDATKWNKYSFCPIEVKPWRTFQEAQYRVGLFSAAVLKLLQNISDPGGLSAGICDYIVIPSIVVMCHSWFLCLTYRCISTTDVVVSGPYFIGGTNTLFDIFILLNVLKDLKEFGIKDILPEIERII